MMHKGSICYIAGLIDVAMSTGRGILVGGGVRHGESLEQALLRELQEEFGIIPLTYTFLGFREVHRVDGDTPTHWLAFDYRAEIDPAQVRIAEPEKVDAIDWFAIDALPEPLHSAIPGALAVRYDELARISKHGGSMIQNAQRETSNY